MSDITTRTGKGAALTHSELDDNFTNLNTDKAELSGADFTGNISVDGNISVTGTVDGRDVAADGTKLDGVEANADVTDTTNVVASLTAGTNITIAADGTISATDSDTVLTSEQVQDIVGAMVSGNTETGITVTYQDADGTIDFVVASQTDENFTTTLKNKLDAIEANADVTDTTNVVASLTAGTNVTIASDGTISATDTNTQLTTEQVQDIVGAMFSGNTETGIAVTYQDDDGTVDFVVTTQSDENFTTVLKNKLDGIETGATADQTDAEIRAAVEAATDSNVFTDADHTKLDGIEANADVTDTDNVVASLTAGTNITISAGGVIASTASGGDLVDETFPQLGGNLDLNSNNITGTGNINTTGDITVSGTAQSNDLNVGSTQQFTVTNIGKVTTSSYVDASAFRVGATSVIDGSRNLENVGNITLSGTVDGRDVAADGTKLDGIAAGAEVNAVDSVNTQTGAVVLDADDISDSTTTNKFTTAGDISKLAGIEAGATADQTASEIRTLVESATDSNVFTDADHTKLDGIEASADVTDTANVTAAGAVMDSELTSEASVKALNQGVATTDSPSFAGLTVDTNTLKVDSTNNRVGILNAAPDVTLDVGSATDAVHVPVGTTAQRPSTPAAGYLRYNSTTGEFEGYTNAWGGLGSGSAQSDIFVDTMTGDGSTTTMTLTNGAATENNTQVYIDGVYQSKSNYSLSGTTITFSTAPPSLSDVEVITIEPTTINEPADGSVTSAKLSGDLTTPGNLDVTGNLTANGMTTSADVNFGDNDKAIFGAGSDLQIFHDGSNSYIQENGTGDLLVGATNFQLKSGDYGESMLTATDDGAVTLFYNNASKLATTNNGIDVTGTVKADSATIDGAVTVNGAGINLDDAYSLTWGDGSAQVRGSGASEAIDLRTASTTRLNIDADGDLSLYNSAGTSQDLFWDASTSRLGLGETNPAHEIHIKSASPQIRLEDDGGTNTYGDVQYNGVSLNVISRGGASAYGAITFARTNGTNIFNTAQINAAGDYRFYDDTGTEKMRWDASTSRLGINNILPDARLEVAAQDNSDVPFKISNVQAENAASQNYNVSFQTKYAEEQFTLYNTDTYRNMSWIGFDNFGQEITFGTGAAGSGTQRMVIDNLGKVGIGDEDPIDRLTVSRLGATWTGVAPAATTTALLHPGTTNATSGSALTIAANAGSASSIYFSSATDNDIGLLNYDHTDNSMQFRTNNVERMRISSAGNVGIGRAPTAISNYKIVEAYNNANNGGIFSAINNTGEFRLVKSGVDGYLNMTDAGSTIFQSNGSERMRISSAGDVGIGTVSPAVALDVHDSGDATIRVVSTGTGVSDDTILRSQIGGTLASNYLYFGDADDNNSGQIRYVHSDDSMRFSAGATTDRLRLYSTDTIFYNGTTEIARFNSSNSFGIGTPSPASKLHAYTASGQNIVRSESGDNYAAFQTVASGTNSGYIFFNNASGETGRITSANGGVMVFYTSNTQERMRINSSGMDVTGTVAADAVTVGGNSVLTSVKSFKTFMTADATVNGSTTYTTKNVFNTTASINVGGFTVATSGVTVPEDGVYMVMANMMYNSTAVRVNPGFRFAINGTGQPEEALSAYIRAASGHNEASSSLSTMYNLSANDVIGLQFAQEGAAGTVNLETGSHIAIYRVS